MFVISLGSMAFLGHKFCCKDRVIFVRLLLNQRQTADNWPVTTLANNSMYQSKLRCVVMVGSVFARD